MKVLYFDCSSGISGNMTLGALLELVEDKDYLLSELDKLHLSGYKIEITSKKKHGITGTHVDVILDEQYHHEHRHLSDIYTIIDQSDINDDAKALAKRIFLRVAKAESKVHSEPLDHVHFHEVGAIDSIIDIVGTAILIDKIKPDKIYSSIVNDGHGFIKCAHGIISVPVPATCEIFATANVTSRQIDIDTELVTPTGAAIISELASSFGSMPAMTSNKIGWGCGTKDIAIPNVLKVIQGTFQNLNDEITVMETNIDDCTPEILGHTMEALLNAGALDVYFTPIYMKKSRPAYKLSILCKNEDVEKLSSLVFKETTTIGIRYHQERRIVLDRKLYDIDTPLGKVTMKACGDDIYPEYESLKLFANKNQMSLKEAYKYIIKTI